MKPVKYLGIRTDNKLNWKAHNINIPIKLKRANVMLYKVRDYVDTGILISIYHILLESHIYYACIICGQNVLTTNHIFIPQKKVIRLIHFKGHNAQIHSVLLLFSSHLANLPPWLAHPNQNILVQE